MTKSSYRFDGTSFTGQKYTYVGPASAPCRKTTGPSNVEMISNTNWSLSGNNSYIYGMPPIIKFLLQRTNNPQTSAAMVDISYYIDEKWQGGEQLCSISSYDIPILVTSPISEYISRICISYQYVVEFYIYNTAPFCFYNLYNELVKEASYAGYIDMGSGSISSSVEPSYGYLIITIDKDEEHQLTDEILLPCSEYPLRATLTNNAAYGEAKYGGYVRVIETPVKTIAYAFYLDYQYYYVINPGDTLSTTVSISEPTIKLLSVNETPITYEIVYLDYFNGTPLTPSEYCNICKMYTY